MSHMMRLQHHNGGGTGVFPSRLCNSCYGCPTFIELRYQCADSKEVFQIGRGLDARSARCLWK